MDKETSTAMTPVGPLEAAPRSTLPSKPEYHMMMLIAKDAGSGKGLVPTGVTHPEQALAVVMAGWELGIPPITALRHIHVIHGRTEPSAQLKMGIVLQREPDARFEFPERTVEKVRCQLWRHNRMVVEVEYTVEDADKAGAFKGNRSEAWNLHQLDMLTWAAVHRVCRLGAADLINAVSDAPIGSAAEHDAPFEVDDVTDEALLVEGEAKEVEKPAEEATPPSPARKVCAHEFATDTKGASRCLHCLAHEPDVIAAGQAS